MITGEALVGIIIAIPIVFTENLAFMAVFGDFTYLLFIYLVIYNICYFFVHFVILRNCRFDGN